MSYTWRINITFSTVMTFFGCSDFMGGCHANTEWWSPQPCSSRRTRRELYATLLSLKGLPGTLQHGWALRPYLFLLHLCKFFLPSYYHGLFKSHPRTCCHVSTCQQNPAVMFMLTYWGNLNMRELQQEEDIQLHCQKPHVNAVFTFSPFGPGGPWKDIRRIRVKKQQNHQCTQHPNQGDSICQFASLSHICYYFKLCTASHEQHATEKHQQGPACSYQDRGPDKDRGRAGSVTTARKHVTLNQCKRFLEVLNHL